jgi:hypothetical protein
LAWPARAREEGVEHFSAYVLEENQPMFELLEERGEARVVSRDGGDGPGGSCMTRRGGAGDPHAVTGMSSPTALSRISHSSPGV